MTLKAEIVADSINLVGNRLTTWLLKYPRSIHSEVMTHRAFCIAEEAELHFDLPRHRRGHDRRLFIMTAGDFARKWFEGVQRTDRWGNSGSFSIRGRLSGMSIRQLDEDSGKIRSAHIVGVSRGGIKPLYRVTLDNGWSVRTSENHLFMTSDGWRRLRDIRDDDRIIRVQRSKLREDVLDPVRLRKINGEWRSVFQRKLGAELREADPLCRECRSQPGVHTHHVLPVYLRPDLAFSRENITLLCEDCHKEAHQVQGWQGGTYLVGVEQGIASIRLEGRGETFDFEVDGVYPNFVANGIVVHNSRNSASSRAIPIEKMIQRVLDDPFIPKWSAAHPGMTVTDEVSFNLQHQLEYLWREGLAGAVLRAQELAKRGVAKSVANRLLEPWMHIEVVLSATEFKNWFLLRDDPAAEPHIRELAHMMKERYTASMPVLRPASTECVWSGGDGSYVPTYGHKPFVEGSWHLPFVDFSEGPYDSRSVLDVIKESVAHAAWVSYGDAAGKEGYSQEDVDRVYSKLVGSQPIHASPTEHVAVSCTGPHRHGNFVGWASWRTFLPNQSGGDYLS